MDEGVDDLTTLQSENMFKTSHNVARAKDDGQGLNCFLGASNAIQFILI